VTLHHRRADYGHAQLGPASLQKDELLDQVLALPLSFISPPVDIGHLVGQALEVCLNRVLGLARIHELTLKKGNLSSRLVSLPVNKGQQGDALASTFSTLSWAFLSARAAQATASLIKAMTLSLTVAASWAEATAAYTASTWVASTVIAAPTPGSPSLAA
jgi:hypothetical protein